MLKEFVEALASNIADAQKAQVEYFDASKDRLVSFPDGKTQVEYGAPPRRKHEARDLDTIVAFALEHKESASIWYNRDSVTCLIDDKDRRDKVTFALRPSPQLLTLAAMEKAQTIDQRGLLKILRSTFKDCCRQVTLIDDLRVAKWKIEDEKASEIGRGKSSMGRSLTAQVIGMDKLPEWVTFTVPVFEQGSLIGVSADVECCLEIIPEGEKFQLFPLAGAIEKALCAGERQLKELLCDADGIGDDPKTGGVPVYYGQP